MTILFLVESFRLYNNCLNLMVRLSTLDYPFNRLFNTKWVSNCQTINDFEVVNKYINKLLRKLLLNVVIY